MFSRVAVGTNDLERAKRFYDAVLGALGFGKGFLRSTGDYVYPFDDGFFIVTRPSDGQSPNHANGGTISFTCESADQVDRWHAAGVANGGRPVEHPPGVRDTPTGGLYRAYLCDPDGNKLCALHRMPA